ncbi:MAG: DUF3168 domain-containing protein [Nitrospinaceae bacterium]|nr:DUF3168 domain-containing protein [Rhodospirillales bacterium]
MKEIQILNQLESDPAIIAIIGKNSWVDWLPENATLPAITCNFESDTPSVTLSNDLLRSREKISVNIWADNKKEAVELVDLVVARLNGFAYRGGTQDLRDEERGLYRYALEYSIF